MALFALFWACLAPKKQMNGYTYEKYPPKMCTLADFRPAHVSFFGGNLVIMGTLPFFEPLKWIHFWAVFSHHLATGYQIQPQASAFDYPELFWIVLSYCLLSAQAQPNTPSALSPARSMIEP